MKSLIDNKLDNLFSSVGCPARAHSNIINLIGRELPNFEGDGWKARDIVRKNIIFFLSTPDFAIFCGW